MLADRERDDRSRERPIGRGTETRTFPRVGQGGGATALAETQAGTLEPVPVPGVATVVVCVSGRRLMCREGGSDCLDPRTDGAVHRQRMRLHARDSASRAEHDGGCRGEHAELCGAYHAAAINSSYANSIIMKHSERRPASKEGSHPFGFVGKLPTALRPST